MSESECAEARMQTNEFFSTLQTSRSNYAFELRDCKTRNVSLMFVGNCVKDVTNL